VPGTLLSLPAIQLRKNLIFCPKGMQLTFNSPSESGDLYVVVILGAGAV
jgi:hypothetical protein